jgi:hypothetical protein
MMKLNLLLLSAAALFNAASAAEQVDLGSAANYAILAKSGISSTAASASDITGSIAVSPIAATAITGFSLTKNVDDDFSTSTEVNSPGRAYAPEYSNAVGTLLTTAVSDMQNAYKNAAGQAADKNITGGQTYNELKTGNIGGETLAPGVYTFTSTITINKDVYLKGTGSASDVFILRTTGSLKQAASTEVILDGVAPENVFWQVAGQVEVGTSAKMNGIILVKTDALFKHSSSLNGRILAQTAVNLKVATIVEP